MCKPELLFTTTLCREKFPMASDAAVDLLKSLLVFDPSNRLTAAEALKHSYFINKYGGLVKCYRNDFYVDYRDQIMESRQEYKVDLGDEFTFESYKPSVNQIRDKLMFEGDSRGLYSFLI